MQELFDASDHQDHQLNNGLVYQDRNEIVYASNQEFMGSDAEDEPAEKSHRSYQRGSTERVTDQPVDWRWLITDEMQLERIYEVSAAPLIVQMTAKEQIYYLFTNMLDMKQRIEEEEQFRSQNLLCVEK